MLPGFRLPPRAGATSPATESFTAEPEDELTETPEHEASESAAVEISPDAVSYRDSQQVCGNCAYMEASGECQALRIQVEAQDGCNLFKNRGL